MLPRTLIAALVATSMAPLWAHAQEEWEEDAYESDYGPPSDYDVSVDVGVSAGVTFDTFHAPLGAHGEWVSAGAYGRVWRPRVAAGWRPYYYGRWEWTSEGWFWVSDEPWGWAAYHYGRWAYDGVYGWVWIPGYQWAPAWVSWRWSGDVVGWAPLGPGLSVYVTTYPFYDAWWTFVPCTRFVSVPVYSVAYGPRYTRHYFDRTTPAPARPAPRPGVARVAPAPTPAWGGPAPRAIEARIGRPLRPARVVAAPSPTAARVRSGEISVYRPDARPAQAPGRGRGDMTGRTDGRGAAAAAPVRGPREPGNAFAPSARGGDASPGPGGWSRREGAAPPPVRGNRAERTDAAPPQLRGERGSPTGRGWTEPQRGPQGGGGAPAAARAPQGPSRERSAAPGGVWGRADGGGRGGGASAPARAPQQHGGGSAPGRGSQQHGGGRPAPAPPHR